MQVEFRDAESGDVAALARLHVSTFAETHGAAADNPTVELREKQWREWIQQNDPRQFCVVVESENGELIGFARGVPYEEERHGEYGGELNKIYLLRANHGQGIGRVLLWEVSKRFLERGVCSMLLFGDANNPTNGFYEAMGAERLYSPNGEFHGGYGWKDLRALQQRCRRQP